MNSMLLVVAMSSGQGPGGYPAAPGYPYPVIPTQGLPSAPPAVLPSIPSPLVRQPGAAQPTPTPMPPGMGQPMSMPMTTPPAANGNGNGNGNGACPTCEEEKKEEEADAPPVYLLERSLRETWLGKKMADCGIKAYGWTAMNYSNSTTSGSNLPMTFNDQANHFQMNQNYVVLEKTLDTSKDERQYGFVLNGIVPGTDSRFTIVRGMFNGQSGEYQFDLYQAYAQAFFPNLGPKGTSVIAGRFQTIIGYELVQAPLTPFVSKSYLFQYNPFTHSGVLATTGLTDNLSVSYGAAVGADNFFFDTTNQFNFLGQLKWAPKDGKFSALLNCMITEPSFMADENFAQYNVYNAVLSYKATEKLTYVADGTFSHMNSIPGVGGTTWYGLANYFIYSFTDKVVGTVRAEVFEDTDGVRTGYKGLYTEATVGVAWSPVPGLIIRPSVRYDYNNESRPFDGDRSMWSGAIEAIFRW